MKRNPFRRALPCLMSLSTLAVTADLSATSLPECFQYPEYVEGTVYQANDKVRHNDHYFNCEIGNWCSGPAWAFEPGVGQVSEDTWLNLGECLTVDPNQPPEVTLNAPDSVRAGIYHSFTAQAFDLTGNLASWDLSIYKYINGDLVDGVSIGSGNLPDDIFYNHYQADMSGSWLAPLNSSSSSSSSTSSSTSSSGSSGESSTSSSSSSSGSYIYGDGNTSSSSSSSGVNNCIDPSITIVRSTPLPGNNSSSTSSSTSSSGSSNGSTSSSSGSYSNTCVSKTGSSSTSGGYSVGQYAIVATATDRRGAQDSQVQIFDVVTKTIKASISPSDTALLGGSLQITVSGNIEPQSLSIGVSPANGSFRRISYGGGTGPGDYLSGATYEWRPTTSGLYMLKGSAGGAYDQEPIMLFNSQQPIATLEHPVSINEGDTVELLLTGMDLTEVNLLTLSVDGLQLTPSIETRLGRQEKYGLEQQYDWIATAGEHQLYAEVFDNDNNVSFIETTIIVESTNLDSCSAQGIDSSSVNTYPNWTQLDWQGLPNNAANGDLLQHQLQVFRAKWWTQSAPGSDDSWEFVCDS